MRELPKLRFSLQTSRKRSQQQQTQSKNQMENGNSAIHERNQSPTSEIEDDVESDNSGDSDDIDEDFYSFRKQATNRRDNTSSPKQQSPTGSKPNSRPNSRPSSRPSSPPSNTTKMSKRMSMSRPVSHHLPDLVVNEDNSAFLTQLTFMIAEFPVPPSHTHTIDSSSSSSSNKNSNQGNSFINFGSWTSPRKSQVRSPNSPM